MRALLVVNPKATATSAGVRDALIEAIGSDLDLDVAQTTARGHASELARSGAEAGVDVVIALGGDGTVNEVVNGLLGSYSRASAVVPAQNDKSAVPPDAARRCPALAVVPGGGTNVFARSLGLPTAPVAATGRLLEALRAQRRRVVGLGRAGDRYFTFCAGLGLDAEVVRKVEAQRLAGRRATPGLYVRTAVAHFYRGADRRQPALTLHPPQGEPIDGLFLGIVANSVPWTYFRNRPINACPRASFDAGLDVLAARELGTARIVRTVGQMFASGPPAGARGLVCLHDADDFTITASRPTAFQLDGDYLGEVEQMRFRSVPRALTVIV